ncbi:hypothetical protein [Streptomyces sp. NPDC057002]|uniref:hypothetical protein n=1 Tax=Streptomyces sp. NPDC057002 TaxID=3345992 RepID=UPI003628039B
MTKYELVDVARREAEANEYFNTQTQKFEVVRQYGSYRVQETFLTPDGDVLLLGYDQNAAERYVIGYHGRSLGEYFDDGQKARAWYARQIAESFKLTVGPPDSLIIRDGDRLLTVGDVQSLRELALSVKQDPENLADETAEELWETFRSLESRLKDLGFKKYRRDVQPQGSAAI